VPKIDTSAAYPLVCALHIGKGAPVVRLAGADEPSSLRSWLLGPQPAAGPGAQDRGRDRPQQVGGGGQAAHALAGFARAGLRRKVPGHRRARLRSPALRPRGPVVFPPWGRYAILGPAETPPSSSGDTGTPPEDRKGSTVLCLMPETRTCTPLGPPHPCGGAGG